MGEYRLKPPRRAKAAADACHKVEGAVVGAYKKVEDTVVGGYKAIEKKFVDAFLEKADGSGPDGGPTPPAGE